MTDPLSLVRKAIEQARQQHERENDRLLAPRRLGAELLSRQLTQAVTQSGGDPETDEMRRWIAHFADMYVLLAWPLDRFPEWEETELPERDCADFLSEWMEHAADTLHGISPALGK